MKPPGTFPRFVIGIDLGATNCRAALFSPEGEMGNRLERRFSPAGERDKEEKALLQLLDDLLEGERKERLLAVGIGSFGPLDLERNRILEAPNRPAWQNVPLRSLVEKHLSVPVFLENDGNVAALGEYRRGAG